MKFRYIKKYKWNFGSDSAHLETPDSDPTQIPGSATLPTSPSGNNQDSSAYTICPRRFSNFHGTLSISNGNTVGEKSAAFYWIIYYNKYYILLWSRSPVQVYQETL